ncbi:Uncharacterized conserved protein, DUF1330 family [Mycolicibacterium rutilum]|uniref:Uncharacterized conserved protein, DUF1330 family n=1 Tax=Mycolicibacterium rutilum TaxID=370526 RepID=A0A1H6JI05_MYCRU|nr:DUF1330 domain-containing protein [Mycolicibacterium rutilum]SEH61585.1 Uncharacterized conserved protein, DUF1330 family [Mycolicibacterium rutilum]
MTAAYLIHADPDSGYGNPAGMAEYAVQVRAIVEAFDGVYHSRHKRTRVLEGDWKPEFITMIEFPSMTRLLEFYESEEYRPWLELRKEAGDGSIVVVEAGGPDFATA